MSEPAARFQLSYAEYLEREAHAESKHEYLRGEAWAMAGGTIEHGRLAMAVGRELALAIGQRPCVVLSSDVRVRVVETDRTTYPDATVVCGKREVAPDDPHAIVNPTLIVEVLSEGTEADDRGAKFQHLRRLPSLLEYVLVSQTAPRIEVFQRQHDGSWLMREHGAGSTVRLASIDGAIDVDRVYFDPTA
jgi:Uma2 family endonuclease